jgi:hypothetical protein
MENPIINPGIELVSAYEFGEKKGVAAVSVYYQMDQGNIETIKIGKYKYIDWNKYKDFEFPHSNRIKDAKEARKTGTVVTKSKKSRKSES